MSRLVTRRLSARRRSKRELSKRECSTPAATIFIRERLPVRDRILGLERARPVRDRLINVIM